MDGRESSGAKLRPEDVAFLERAWLAWHSMPRRASGKPPSWRSIELEHNLAEGTFSKMFKGHRREHGLAMYERLARALRTEVLWLVHGIGMAPKPSGPVPPRDEPVERSTVERALTVFRHGLMKGGVPLSAVRATVAAAGERLHAFGVAQGPEQPEDVAKGAAAAFARANGVPDVVIDQATSLPAPPTWTAEQWYTRIKSIAAERQ